MILRGFESASNGMMSLIDSLDNSANNLANVNTTGYKRSLLTFKNTMDSSVYQNNGELIKGQSTENNRYLGDVSMGSETMRITYDFSQGGMLNTQVPLDMAIQGDGFFKIQDSNGEIAYTRNGSFCANHNNFLVTKEGDFVLSNQNQPIRLQNDEMEEGDNLASYKIMVTQQGQLEAYNGTVHMQLGSLGIFNFADKEDLESIGEANFRPRSETNLELVSPPTKYEVQQGMLETSNSSTIEEMLNTIKTSRNYESLSKVITTNSDLLDSAISVGRIRSS